MAANQFAHILKEKIMQYPTVYSGVTIEVLSKHCVWVTFLQHEKMWVDFYVDSIEVNPRNILLEREQFGIADIDRAADYVIKLLDCKRIENFRLSWFTRWQLSKYRELTIFFAVAVVYFALMSLAYYSWDAIIVIGLLLVPLVSCMLISETDPGDMANLYELAMKLHRRSAARRVIKKLPLPIGEEIATHLKLDF